MRTFTKIAVRTVLILIAVFVLSVVALRSFYIFLQMPTPTMEPSISTNDVVMASKHFDVSSLRSGDLVIVDLPFPEGHGSIYTVRKIEQQTNTPSGQFYLLAANTNGIDSHILGALPAADIRGRVIHIFRGVL